MNPIQEQEIFYNYNAENSLPRNIWDLSLSTYHLTLSFCLLIPLTVNIVAVKWSEDTLKNVTNNFIAFNKHKNVCTIKWKVFWKENIYDSTSLYQMFQTIEEFMGCYYIIKKVM